MLLIKGSLSALSGLGYEVTFEYRNKTTRIRSDHGSFPAPSETLFLIRRTGISRNGNNISALLFPPLTLNRHLGGGDPSARLGICCCADWFSFHLSDQWTMIVMNFKDGIPTQRESSLPFLCRLGVKNLNTQWYSTVLSHTLSTRRARAPARHLTLRHLLFSCGFQFSFYYALRFI